MTPPILPRRETLLAATAAALALATRATAQPPPPTARGTVYEHIPAGRRGIPNIMVSNGEAVILTAPDGTWQLPLADGQSVFVIKPTGWTTPVDPTTKLPAYAYLHSPTGTPAALNLRYPGIAPTGPLPPSIDFQLRRQEEPTTFDALLLTDPQPETPIELDHVRDDAIARLAEFPAAFGLTLGDLMFDDLSFYDRYNRLIATRGIPWHNCPGNHDMNYEAPNNELSRETYKRVFGARHHAFQYGGATFFLLDNVEYLGTDPTRPLAAGKYRGRFGPTQLAFVRNVLAHTPTDSLVVICHHIPLHTLQSPEPADTNTDTPDFLAAIATHPNCVSFAGHTHTNEHWYLGPDGKPAPTGHHHQVLSAVSGSWWSGPDDVRGIPLALATDGTPNGFHLLSVAENRATSRLIPTHDPAAALLRLSLETQPHQSAPETLREYRPGALLTGPIALAQLPSARLVVNVFEGGPNTTVDLSANGGPPTRMTQTTRIDPFVAEIYGRNAATLKPWVKPELSTHLWQSPLPPTLGRGTHRLAVRALDEHARPHEAFMILEIL